MTTTAMSAGTDRIRTTPPWTIGDDAEPGARHEAFAQDVDALRTRVEAQISKDDGDRIRRIGKISRLLERAGRMLIHFSFEPVGFFTGVTALGVHKLLQTTEIGHSALHGAFDRTDAEAFHADKFVWDAPMDERTWRYAHNVRHHGFTNVVGEDPDISTGFLRVSFDAPHHFYHWLQIPLAVAMAPNLGPLLAFRYTGLAELFNGKPRPERADFLKARTPGAIVEAGKIVIRKMGPYTLREYVFFPMLAGPFFPKVILGNWLASSIRDVWLSASIFCTHQGSMPLYSKESRPKSKGEHYARQVEATRNVRMGKTMSVLNGALELHIEHHLFPKLPPNRLREVAPELQALCKKHGVEYRVTSWPQALGDIFRHFVRTSRRQPPKPRAGERRQESHGGH